MKNTKQQKLEVIVNNEPDLNLVPESLMDAFIIVIVKEISCMEKTEAIKD